VPYRTGPHPDTAEATKFSCKCPSLFLYGYTQISYHSFQGEECVIIYDLRCEKGHKFEGWFKDRAAFENQKKEKLITCPICGASDIEMVISSIAIMGKDIRSSEKEKAKDLSTRHGLKTFLDYIDKNFEDVGDKFAEVALKINQGEEDSRNIKGTTTEREEENLREEGVQFFKIPVLKYDS
jgi:hypothetical protein